jgi:hypothetical protein
LMAAEVLQIDTVEEQEVGELDAVDGAETIKFEDTGDGIGVFDLCEPCVGDVKLGITFGFGNLLAEVGDFTRGNPQATTDVFELFARDLSANHWRKSTSNPKENTYLPRRTRLRAISIGVRWQDEATVTMPIAGKWSMMHRIG